MYTTDEYGVIVNGEDTYAQAVADLREHGSIVLNWGDEDGTLLNILLSHNPPRHGYMGGMVDSEPNKLWVGVAGFGAFAFTTGLGDLTPDYIAPKFNLRSASSPTTIKLAELLTAIRKGL